jgi:hypothetical protein
MCPEIPFLVWFLFIKKLINFYLESCRGFDIISFTQELCVCVCVFSIALYPPCKSFNIFYLLMIMFYCTIICLQLTNIPLKGVKLPFIIFPLHIGQKIRPWNNRKEEATIFHLGRVFGTFITRD